MQEHQFNRLSGALGPKISVEGETFLYFGGTAYLGIPQHEGFLAHYLTGIKRFGLNNGTSRNNNIQLGIYNEVEKYAAERYQSAAALITSSGFLAAQFAIKHLTKWGEMCYAPQTHPALWQNNDPSTTGSFSEWAAEVVAKINSSEQEHWVLISNSMNNLYPERYDFSFLAQLDPQKKVVLFLDDSHGIGINFNGAGLSAAIAPPKNVRVLVVASMAKALGVDAGMLLGDEEIISAIRESNDFLGASPPAAAGLYAFMQSQSIYQEQLNKLQALTQMLATALQQKKDWHFIPDFPVFFSKNAELSHQLFKEQVLISSFPYPDKSGPLVNRIVLSSWHEKVDIEKLINLLSKI